MNGYILESRTILNSEIWRKPPLYFKVWHYLLLNAQHRDYGNLKRGQLFTSIDTIREACSYYVGYRKMTPSRKEIFGVLDWLRNPNEGNNEGNNESNMIETTKVTHGMVVSVVNYGIYQDPMSYGGNAESDTKVTTKSLRKSEQGNNINKNEKNDKNVKDITPLYPPFTPDATNVANLRSILNSGVHGDTEYFKSHKDLYSCVRDWMAYKDAKKPKSSNHYDTQTGICKLLTQIVNHAREYGDVAVKDAVDKAIANNWMGISWDDMERKYKGKKKDILDEW